MRFGLPSLESNTNSNVLGRAAGQVPRLWVWHVLVLFLALTGCVTSSLTRHSGPWDLNALSKAPAITWGATTGLVQELFYEGEPLHGEPTRVFAYLGRPAVTNEWGSTGSRSIQRRPAMVLVHGGGGKAFKEWAEHW